MSAPFRPLGESSTIVARPSIFAWTLLGLGAVLLFIDHVVAWRWSEATVWWCAPVLVSVAVLHSGFATFVWAVGLCLASDLLPPAVTVVGMHAPAWIIATLILRHAVRWWRVASWASFGIGAAGALVLAITQAVVGAAVTGHVDVALAPVLLGALVTGVLVTGIAGPLVRWGHHLRGRGRA